MFQDQECSAKNGIGSVDEERLRIGSTLVLRVTILQIIDVPVEYTDVFCQFKYVLS